MTRLAEGQFHAEREYLQASTPSLVHHETLMSIE
jgi:hypothetical protein